MRTTVRLPDSLLEEAKLYARQQHTTLTELLADGLRLVMKKGTGKPEKVVPLVLPVCSVSKARAGLAEGVPPDAWNWSAGKLESLMDELEGRLTDESAGR
jgi:hypothetical protein